MRNVVETSTGTRPTRSPIYPQNNAASGLMQNDEQNINVVSNTLLEAFGGIKTPESTMVKWAAKSKSKKSKKFPMRTIATDFLVSTGREEEDGIFSTP
ncbi:MAG: hypothetical protein ACK4V2_01085 [Pseudomonadota bacterium]|nr:hypothetical protein [Alphaproteobacteria bacterium]